MPDPAGGAQQPRVMPRVSADADGGGGFPTIRPRLAATLILLDKTGRDTKVLMGRRHGAHKFMPGKYVFPGGRIETADRRMEAAGELHATTGDKLVMRAMRPSASHARGLALAAIRETFEETGLVLGLKSLAAKPAPAGPWADYARFGVLPDLREVHFIARAITPPGRPRRYDTHFFSMDATAIAHRVEDVVTPDSELVELAWVQLAEARKLDLPHITHTVLDELDRRVAAGMARDLVVPFFRPSHGRFLREEL